MLSPSSFFPSMMNDQFIEPLFANAQFVWDLLPKIQPFIHQLVGEGQRIDGTIHQGAYIGDNPLVIEEGAIVEPGAYIIGPAYIGKGVIVRHGAYVRENVILLNNSLLGHASEAKNSLLLPGAHAPHFNYVGDSILGTSANIGAGTKLSNLTMVSEKDPTTGKRPTIKFRVGEVEYDTGLAKLGAILGDEAQTGCNSVLNPGCLVGRRSLVYANLGLRKGYYPPDSIIKLRQTVEVVPRR